MSVDNWRKGQAADVGHDRRILVCLTSNAIGTNKTFADIMKGLNSQLPFFENDF